MTRADALRILELDDRRTPDQVRATYRELVKVWHPDRFANDPGLRAKADRRLQEINRAYAVLQDRAETVEPPHAPSSRVTTLGATKRSAPTRWSMALLILGGLLTGAAIIVVVLMLVAPTEPALAPRPISGTDLLAAPLPGNGSLIVLNADGRDAVLVFVDAGAQTRALYIRAGERLQMLDVAPGAYRIWVAAGRGWLRDHFATDQVFQEITEPLTFSNGASPPQMITIASAEPGALTQLRARSPFLLSVRN